MSGVTSHDIAVHAAISARRCLDRFRPLCVDSNYGFDVNHVDSAMRKGKVSCLHLFVCGVGSHDRFSSSGTGEFS